MLYMGGYNFNCGRQLDCAGRNRSSQNIPRQDGMPLAGICSASMMAKCQPSHIQSDGSMVPFPMDLAYKKPKWDVVDASDESPDSIGHVAFSAGEFMSLKEGRLYLGMLKMNSSFPVLNKS